jgi:hypothetical protein
MRSSIFAATVLAVAALAIGACSENDKPKTLPTTGASGPANSSPQPSASPGGTDRRSICAGYDKAQGETEAKLIVVLPKVAEGLNDPAKAGPAMTELKAVMASFDASLSAEAARSQDAELKAAIEADLGVLRKAGTEIQAAGTDVPRALAALQTDEFQAVGEKVKAICQK